MDRRNMLRSILPAVGASAIIASEGHWLDAWSSQDIEHVLRGLGHYQVFRSAARRCRRQQAAARRRESRTENVVIWRGLVTSLPVIAPFSRLPIPGIIEPVDEMRTVESRRRDVEIATIQADGITWQGYDLPAGTRILIDSRVRDMPSLGEIIDTPHQRRVHIWPSPKAEAKS